MTKTKVIFIDDDEAVLRWIKLALEKTGKYEVAVQQSAEGAAQAVRAFKPQIIFIDIKMPVIEGPAIAANIKSDPAFTKVPIVFLTGVVTAEEVKAHGGKIGGQTFLAKPINLEMLVNCIETQIRAQLV